MWRRSDEIPALLTPRSIDASNEHAREPSDAELLLQASTQRIVPRLVAPRLNIPELGSRHPADSRAHAGAERAFTVNAPSDLLSDLIELDTTSEGSPTSSSTFASSRGCSSQTGSISRHGSAFECARSGNEPAFSSDAERLLWLNTQRILRMNLNGLQRQRLGANPSTSAAYDADEDADATSDGPSPATRVNGRADACGDGRVGRTHLVDIARRPRAFGGWLKSPRNNDAALSPRTAPGLLPTDTSPAARPATPSSARDGRPMGAAPLSARQCCADARNVSTQIQMLDCTVGGGGSPVDTPAAPEESEVCAEADSQQTGRLELIERLASDPEPQRLLC